MDKSLGCVECIISLCVCGRKNMFKWINVASGLTCFQWSVTLKNYVIKAIHLTCDRNPWLELGFKFHRVSTHMAVMAIYSTLMAEADELCVM